MYAVLASAVGLLVLCSTSKCQAAAVATSSAPTAPQVYGMSKEVNVTSNDNPSSTTRYYRDGGYLGTIGTRNFTMNFDTCLGPNVETTSNCNIAGGNSFADIVSSSVLDDPGPNGNIVTICTSSKYDHTWVFNTINIDGTNGLAYAQDIAAPGETGQGIFPVIINVANKIPTCTRNPILFPPNDLPQYGGAGSIIGPGGFLYLFGGGWGPNPLNIYVARVDPAKYNTLSAYSYWDGFLFNADNSSAIPVLTGIYGGSVSYSNYYKAYLFLNTQIYFSGVGAQLAVNPWGPFSNQTTIIQDSSNARGTYQPNALPQFDTSGKTLVVRYCAPVGFYQKVITITWK